MSHGTILLCENLRITASQRALVDGIIFVAKASPKFRCTIYCSYFIEQPGTQYVRVIHTFGSYDNKRVVKFWQRTVTSDDMNIRGVDIFAITDLVIPIGIGRHWFDLVVGSDIVSSHLLTVH